MFQKQQLDLQIDSAVVSINLLQVTSGCQNHVKDVENYVNSQLFLLDNGMIVVVEVEGFVDEICQPLGEDCRQNCNDD